MKSFSRSAPLAACAICLALGAAAAFAQTPPPAPNPGGPMVPAPGGPTAPHGMGGMDHSGGMGGMGGMDHGGGMGGMGGMDHGGGMGGGMGGMDHGGGMGGKGGMEHGMAGMMRHMLCGPTEHVEGRLAYLKAELNLTPQQQQAWSTFADAYRAAIEKTAKTCAAPPPPVEQPMQHGVLGQLTMMDKHMTEHLDLVRGLKRAIEPLFAVLTEEQKRIADHTLTHVMDVGMPKMGH